MRLHELRLVFASVGHYAVRFMLRKFLFIWTVSIIIKSRLAEIGSKGRVGEFSRKCIKTFDVLLPYFYLSFLFLIEFIQSLNFFLWAFHLFNLLVFCFLFLLTTVIFVLPIIIKIVVLDHITLWLIFLGRLSNALHKFRSGISRPLWLLINLRLSKPRDSSIADLHIDKPVFRIAHTIILFPC